MTPLDMYRETVRAAIRARTGTPILNGSFEHTGIITQEMIGHAEHNIRILTNRLDTDCYGREAVRNAARSFLADPDHRMEILIETGLWDNGNYQWRQHPFFRDLLEFAVGENPRLTARAVSHGAAARYKF